MGHATGRVAVHVGPEQAAAVQGREVRFGQPIRLESGGEEEEGIDLPGGGLRALGGRILSGVGVGRKRRSNYGNRIGGRDRQRHAR